MWSDRKKKVIEPLFPGYIFACVDERGRLDVLKTQGISRCIAFGGSLAVVSQQEIDLLKLLQKKPDWLEPVQVLPPRGTTVHVQSGPLKGLEGLVLEQRGHVRLVVEIPSIRQSVKVVVPASMVAWDQPAMAA